MSEAAYRILVEHRLLSEEKVHRLRDHAHFHTALPVPLREGLPDTLAVLAYCLTLDPAEIIDVCAAYLNVDLDSGTQVDTEPSQRHSRSLLSDLAWTLLAEDDEEGCIVTATLFSRLLDDRRRGLPPRAFLREISDAYVEQTRYLLPLLADYARATVAIGRVHAVTHTLFLRDGLVFWPAMRALTTDDPRPLRHLVYTRPMRDHGEAPIILDEGGTTLRTITPDHSIHHSTLLDVGLYGSLIKALHDGQFLAGRNVPLFIGSRNPCIFGYLNYRNPTGIGLSVRELVSFVDTIECLLKPFQFVTQCVGGCSEVFVRPGDMISFMCSARFMHALYHYAREGLNEGKYVDEHPRGSWFLEEPIPTWSGAKAFIAGWNAPHCVTAADVQSRLR